VEKSGKVNDRKNKRQEEGKGKIEEKQRNNR